MLRRACLGSNVEEQSFERTRPYKIGVAAFPRPVLQGMNVRPGNRIGGNTSGDQLLERSTIPSCRGSQSSLVFRRSQKMKVLDKANVIAKQFITCSEFLREGLVNFNGSRSSSLARVGSRRNA